MTATVVAPSSVSGVRIRRFNPFAAVGAALTSVLWGLLFAAVASVTGYALSGPPPDATEVRRMLGDALPGATLAVTHVTTGPFDVNVADFRQYQLGHTDGVWDDPPPGALATVAANLGRTGWAVTGPSYSLPMHARVVVARGFDTEVIAYQADDSAQWALDDDVRVTVRHDPPEATGAAVLFGVGGAVLVWWMIARLRRRTDFTRSPGSLAVLLQVFALVILTPMVAFSALNAGYRTPANLATVGSVVRPPLWNHLGLPWLATWWAIGLGLMLVGLVLALVSTRRS